MMQEGALTSFALYDLYRRKRTIGLIDVRN